jgi:hypothetical protein
LPALFFPEKIFTGFKLLYGNRSGLRPFRPIFRAHLNNLNEFSRTFSEKNSTIRLHCESDRASGNHSDFCAAPHFNFISLAHHSADNTCARANRGSDSGTFAAANGSAKYRATARTAAYKDNLAGFR